jgi:hypothetical protein
MKLSDTTTKLTCMKSKAVRVLAAATLAGAFLAAAVPAAQAQQFAVGVQFGGPRYVAPVPVYYGPDRGFYERRRIEEERRAEFIRHERWEREHRFHDHDRFDHDRRGR